MGSGTCVRLCGVKFRCLRGCLGLCGFVRAGFGLVREGFWAQAWGFRGVLLGFGVGQVGFAEWGSRFLGSSNPLNLYPVNTSKLSHRS